MSDLRVGAKRAFSRRLAVWIIVLTLMVALLAFARSQHTGSEVEDAVIMEILDPRPGMIVAEIGAGRGQATVKVARRLGSSGHMFSTEVDPERLDQIKEAVDEAGLENVTVLEGSQEETNLLEQCCDAIFMSKVYHHFKNPTAINQSLYRALRPGGVLVVLDFAPSFWRLRGSAPKGVPESRGGHGVPQDLVIDELTAAGFTFERSKVLWWYWPGKRYVTVFQKPSQAPNAASAAMEEGFSASF